MPDKIKHLEFIQQNVTRMSSNSFLLKGWTITLTSGLIALTKDEVKETAYLLSFLICFIFWLLDAYYLSIEKKYIALYNDVRVQTNAIDFSLDISGDVRPSLKVYRVFFTKSLVVFYGALIVIGLGLLILPVN